MESSSTVLSLLEAQVVRQPDTVAVTLLHNGETPAGTLTYRQLAQQARTIGAHLLRSGVTPGERVLLVYIEGLEFLPALLGCLYAGVVAVPTPAPDALRSKRALPHMQAVYADAQACRILTTEHLKALLPVTPELPILTTEDLPADAAAEALLPMIQPNQLAYLQYTSGSTGTPKGVMITHANVLANLTALNDGSGYDTGCVTLTWMPHTHDFGLVEGLLRPLLAGVPNYIMPPGAYLRKPMRWLKAISRFGVSHCGGASFAYQQCLQHITSEECADLDLSHWRLAALGAEPIRASMLEEFAAAFAPYGFARNAFCPAYGLAEATLMVTNIGIANELTTRSLIIDGASRTLTGCGQPWGDTEIKVVDPTTLQPLPDGVVGEIWVTGGSVARGYWNRPDETREIFGNTLNGKIYLRTGDLGMIDRSILFISGRLKDLIILNGQNYYPSDIEWGIDPAHPLLKNGSKAAFAIDDAQAGAERLVIVCEVDPRTARTVDLAAVVVAIRERLAADFALSAKAVTLIRRGTLPKTPSGKVQRQACRRAWLNGELESLFTWQIDCDDPSGAISPGGDTDATDPLTPTEQTLRELWSELLGTDRIGKDANFFVLGGSSLLAVQLMVRVEQRFQRQLPLERFVFNPTIAHLATEIDRLLSPIPVTAEPFPGEQVLPTMQGEVLPPGAANELKRLYEEIGQPEAIADMRDLSYLAPLHSRLERLIRGVPQPLAFPLLRQLVRRPWAQRRYWAGEAALIREFHAVIDTDVDVATLVRNSLFYGLLNRYGFDLVRTGIPASARSLIANVTGVSYLEQARNRGQGVILVSHHGFASGWLPRVEFQKLRQYVIFGVDAIVPRTPLDMTKAAPILFARQLEVSLQVLRRGETVLIAPDGGMGDSHSPEVPFHGRRSRFAVSFAELALMSGAVVIPVLGEIQPDGNITLRLMPSLDPGDETQSHAVRIESLVTQYQKHLSDLWGRMPWVVDWYKMAEHLSLPSI